MNILIAPDKFKGSLTATEVGVALQKGILESLPTANVEVLPLADGGEGSIEVIRDVLGLKRVEVTSVDPLGRKIRSHYYKDDDNAYVELATASGLQLLAVEERDPELTSTYGTGLIINHALHGEIERIYLFVGGSATNDCGIGILQALGFKFRNEEGHRLTPIGKNLQHIVAVEAPASMLTDDIELIVLSDVTNPLYGPEGAAHVYGAQKGGSAEHLSRLDHGLRSFADVIEQYNGIDISEMEGAGAAGGVSGGLMALAGAKIKSGISVIADITNLDFKIAAADLVITGEGCLDRQSIQGKVIDGVLDIARHYGKKSLLVVGQNQLSKKELYDLEVSDCYALVDVAESVEQSIADAERLLIDIGRTIGERFSS